MKIPYYKLLLIALLIVGCDRYQYIADDKKIDKWFGNTYIKTEKEPDDSTMPSYVQEKMLEWKADKLISRKYFGGNTFSNNNAQIYRNLKTYNRRDKQFTWKEADTIIYHWVKVTE